MGQRVLAWILYLVGAGALAGIAGGFFGGVHPALDSLSVLRPQFAMLAGALVLPALILRHKRTAALALAGSVGAVAGFAPVLAPQPQVERAGLIAYQHNLLYTNSDLDAVLAEIRHRQPDFVTFQEIARDTRPILAELAADYPHQIECSVNGGLAVAHHVPAARARRRRLP